MNKARTRGEAHNTGKHNTQNSSVRQSDKSEVSYTKDTSLSTHKSEIIPVRVGLIQTIDFVDPGEPRTRVTKIVFERLHNSYNPMYDV